jgi:hypothetical protein
MIWTHETVFRALVARSLRNTLGKLTPEGKPYVNDYVVLYEQESSWREDIFQKIKPAIEERGRSQKIWSLCEVHDWNRLADGLGLNFAA